MQRSKLPVELSIFFPGYKFCFHHIREQSFGFNQRHLNVAVWIAIERKLTSHTFGKCCKSLGILFTQMCKNVSALCFFVKVFVIGPVSGQQIIEFANQSTNRGDKLYQSFGNQNHAEVHSPTCSVGHGRSNLLNDLVECHIFLLHFLRDNADIRLALQRTLQSDVRCRSSHQLDEMPILTSRITVAFDITGQLCVSLRSCVKSERGFDLIVFQIAVNGFRAADYLHTTLLGSIIFGQNTGVGIRVITTDNNDGLYIKLANNL